MVDGEAVIDGLRWRYSVSDNLDASTWAINVHGYMAGGGVYWRESSRLAAKLGLRVINPNLPGFSGSDPLPWDDLRMSSFARGLAGLLDHLGASTALVLGHSMGGAVAMQVAHDFPERTLGVIYRDGVATSSWKQRRGLFTHLLRPIVPDLGTALDFLAAFATDIPDLALSRITSMAATAAPDIRLNTRSLRNTLPVGAMLMACDYTAMAAAVGDAGDIPILPMHGRFDRLVPPSTGREFGELVGREVWWIMGSHSWMIPRPATQLNVLRDTDRGEAFMEEVRDRARALKRPAA
ncbi:MAG: hydrolase [Acidimicrobiales bacterium]|nr:hydrolase [Acidimicrobiales bacterium]